MANQSKVVDIEEIIPEKSIAVIRIFYIKAIYKVFAFGKSEENLLQLLRKYIKPKQNFAKLLILRNQKAGSLEDMAKIG